jgi:hypothetical protein
MRTVLHLSAATTAPHPLSVGAVLSWAAVIGVCFAVAYRVSIRRHPYRPCRKCGESGKHRGTIFTRSFRACARCGGTGRELRRFAREPEPRD